MISYYNSIEGLDVPYYYNNKTGCQTNTGIHPSNHLIMKYEEDTK
jgi:hypothetical protein